MITLHSKEYFEKEYGESHIRMVMDVRDVESMYGLMDEYAVAYAQAVVEDLRKRTKEKSENA